MLELEKIITRVKYITGVDIRNKSRKREVIYAKKIYYHVSRQKGYTFESIGKLVGVDHATVLWHCNDTPYLMKQDAKFMNDYLRVQGKPTKGKCSRDYFDLSVAMFLNKTVNL